MGMNNAISANLDHSQLGLADGRMRYSRTLRNSAYSLIIEEASKLRPDLEFALCLEESTLWESVGISERLEYCNCVL